MVGTTIRGPRLDSFGSEESDARGTKIFPYRARNLQGYNGYVKVTGPASNSTVDFNFYERLKPYRTEESKSPKATISLSNVFIQDDGTVMHLSSDMRIFLNVKCETARHRIPDEENDLFLDTYESMAKHLSLIEVLKYCILMFELKIDQKLTQGVSAIELSRYIEAQMLLHELSYELYRVEEDSALHNQAPDPPAPRA